MRLTIELTLEEYHWLRQQQGKMKMGEYVHQLIAAKRKELAQGAKRLNIWGEEQKPKSQFSWEQESGSRYDWAPNSDMNLF